MNIAKNDFADYVNKFKLKDLFIDMGWDIERSAPLPINMGDIRITANILANKSGFKIIECKIPACNPEIRRCTDTSRRAVISACICTPAKVAGIPRVAVDSLYSVCRP